MSITNFMYKLMVKNQNLPLFRGQIQDGHHAVRLSINFIIEASMIPQFKGLHEYNKLYK